MNVQLFTPGWSAWVRPTLALATTILLSASPTAAQEFTEPEEEITENKVTTWIGNTYGGVWDGNRSTKSKTFGKSRRGHVQMGIDAIAVADDGTVYTKALQPDESHKQYGIFTQDGDDLGQFGWFNPNYAPYHKKGRGNAVAVNEDYVILEVANILNGGKTDYGRLRRFDRSTGLPTETNPNKSSDIKVSDNVEGLAIHENELYVSDYPGNKILVYDVDTFATVADAEPLREFTFAEPGRLTVDDEGYLWIIRKSDNRIYKYSSTGISQKKKIVLPEGSVATDVRYNHSAGNVYSGLLMVADNGPDLDIKFYDPKKAFGTPTVATPVATFGEKGGIYSGIPGEYQPTKLMDDLSGIDHDQDGNLYISTVGRQRTNAHTSLLSFTPSGELRWKRHNLAFIDVGVMDPRSENDVYTEYFHYKVKYDQGLADNQAKGWSIQGYTMDRHRYPDDIRNIEGIRYNNVGQAMAPLKVVYVEGQKIIYYTHQLGQYLAAFRVSPSTDGEILIPCMVMSKKYRPEMPWPADRPTTGAWIWMDQNGDGQMESSEFVSSGRDYKGWAWDINDNADIWWLSSSSDSIKLSIFQGLNEQGVPQYDFEQVEDYETPAMFDGIKRIVYDEAEDAMYITGYTEEYPNEKPFEVGPDDSKSVWSACAGRVLARFDNWAEGNRAPTWVVEDLVFDPSQAQHDDIFITSVDVAGEYIFLARNSGARGKEYYAGKAPNTRKVEVYQKSDGQPVGYLLPGPQANHGIGQLDMIYGMRAFQRQNGQYIVFEEDDWFGNVLVHQWSPKAQAEVEGQRPYQNVAHTLPGTIEGEHYDEGGAEVAYHDDDDKEGDDFYRRGDKVDVPEKVEASNGRSVGFTEAGEWLEYTVNATGGTYDVVLSYATGTDTRGDLQMSLDGEVIGTFSGEGLENNGWLAFQTITLSGVTVPDGVGQVLRLEFVNGGGFDIDAVVFVSTAAARQAQSMAKAGPSTDPSWTTDVYPNPVTDIIRVRRTVTAREEIPKVSGVRARGGRTAFPDPNVPVLNGVHAAGGRTAEEIRKGNGPNASYTSREVEGAILHVLSLTGQTLIRQVLDASGEVDVSTLPAGMYVVHINQPGLPQQQTKIIKR